jgi:protein involved in polysaccharide export with SLBB domain
MNQGRNFGPRWIALGFWLGSSMGCLSVGRPMPEMAAEINSTLQADTMALMPGDLLEVRFFQFPDLTHETRIRFDGRASFLMVGDLPVAGLTVEVLQKNLGTAYARSLQKAEFSVLLKEAAVRNVVVMGEVHKPGDVPVPGGVIPLIEAIGKAGGPLKESAHLESMILLRWLPKEQKQVAWKIDANRDLWGSAPSILLQPHDVVFVPNTGIDRVDIWIDQHITKLIPLPGWAILGAWAVTR